MIISACGFELAAN